MNIWTVAIAALAVFVIRDVTTTAVGAADAVAVITEPGPDFRGKLV